MSLEPPIKKVKVGANASAPVAAAVSSGVSSAAHEIHLMPELIARVATYSEAVNSSELWNICLAVGPATSRVIRHYYLKGNIPFLARCVRLFCSKRIGSIAVRDYYLAWMAVNTNWKAYATKANMDDCKIVCRREGQRNVNILQPIAAFINPAVAMQFGLMEPLKYLVERKSIDIDSYEWTPFLSSQPRHLLFWSMDFAQKSDDFDDDMFRYLLLNSDCRSRVKQELLLMLTHTAYCSFEKGQCPVSDICGHWKRLRGHMAVCRKQVCTQNCDTGRYWALHYINCKNEDCATCTPTREVILKCQTIPSAGKDRGDKKMLRAQLFVEALRNLSNDPCRNIRCKLIHKESSKPLFTALFKYPSICKNTGRQFFPFLNIFMQHPDFDINGQIVPMFGRYATPLQATSFQIIEILYKRDLPNFRVRLRGAEILLESGADPNLGHLGFPGGYDAPVQLLRRQKRLAEGEFLAQSQETESFHDVCGKYYDEAIALLER